MYTLGLCSVSFRKNNPAEILNTVRTSGLSVIEWGSDVHANKDDLQMLARIASAQEFLGIRCSSYGTYFRIGETPISELESYICAASVLGTNVLRVWCGNKNSQEYTDAERKKLLAECKEAARIAEKYGAVLCTECHGGTYTNEKEAAIEMLREVSSPSFKTYWQPNQYKTVEENIKYAERVRMYVENVHVFNWSGKDKYPLADAVGTWKRYLDVLGKDKTLLLEFMPDGNIDSLDMEAKALRQIAGV